MELKLVTSRQSSSSVTAPNAHKIFCSRIRQHLVAEKKWTRPTPLCRIWLLLLLRPPTTQHCQQPPTTPNYRWLRSRPCSRFHRPVNQSSDRRQPSGRVPDRFASPKAVVSSRSPSYNPHRLGRYTGIDSPWSGVTQGHRK